MLNPHQSQNVFANAPYRAIKDLMADENLDVISLASKLRLPLSATEHLIAGNVTIDIFLAEKLEHAFGVSADYWLTIEKDYVDFQKRLNGASL